MHTLRRGLLAMVVAVALAPVGCSSVTLRHPLPANGGASDRAQLEGCWRSGGEVVFVEFSDDGVGRIAGVDWKDGRFQLGEAEMVVSRAADRGFLSVRTRGTSGWDRELYLLEFHATDDGDLVLWAPDPEAFAVAVDQGRLEGTVERDEHSLNVTLTGAPEKVLAFLGDPASGELFDLRRPIVVTRVTAPPGPHR